MHRDVFKAIADPTRREIISLLARQALNLNAIADHFHISRPAISKHIKILEECGLIVIKKQGREHLCYPDLSKLKTVADWTSQYHAFWSASMDALENFLSSNTDNPDHK